MQSFLFYGFPQILNVKVVLKSFPKFGHIKYFIYLCTKKKATYRFNNKKRKL